MDKDDYSEILWGYIIMGKLVQKVNFNLSVLPKTMYCYGEASFEANQEMQEPLEKLYKYESHPDIREKIREYICDLDTEIKRVNGEIVNTSDISYEARMMARLDALLEVKNDLQGRLEEKYNGKFI